MQLRSVLTCPKYRNRKEEEMPLDSCVFFFQCERCRELLKPLKVDCCVFSSYGAFECPPKQNGQNCC